MSARDPLDELWARHHAAWREPAQIASGWHGAGEVDRTLFRARTRGRWWQTLAELGGTLLVTREYEHLVMALRATPDGPDVTYLPVPHPSGLTVDAERRRVILASTRNPNQIVELRPVAGTLPRRDVDAEPAGHPLIPVQTRFLPGCLYLHDLALIDGVLHANAVGQNAVVRLHDNATGAEPVWWPESIETASDPLFGRNHLQLNSIAAGPSLEQSFFSASVEKPSARRPGHLNFPVDRRGVVFSGASRRPVVRGLTRPHSARLHDDRLWIDDSGYGRLVTADLTTGSLETVAQLPGWTRGLCFRNRVAIVGTSRVIPRFRHYAPGLDVETSECGLHAVDIDRGEVLGSLIWPRGNQIFAIEWAPPDLTTGLPFPTRRPSKERSKRLFYAFEI